MKLNDKYLVLIAAAGVLAITLLTFLPSLDSGFVDLDDDQYVLTNTGIALRGQALVAWAFSTYYAYNYHPVTWLSFALDHAVWGLDPFGYHLTNVLLHACNGFLVVILAYLLLRRGRTSGDMGSSATRDIVAAAAIGAFFSMHPLRVESVSWVTERKDVLFAFFYFLSVIAYVRYVDAGAAARRAFLYIVSVSLFCLSDLSKPMAISLPVVLLVLDVYPLRRVEQLRFDRRMLSLLLEKAPYVLAAVALAVLTILAQGTSGQIRNIQELSLGERSIVALRAVFFYLGKFFWPVDLAPFYPIAPPVSLSAMDIVRIALFLGMTGLGIFLWKRNRLFLTVWVFTIVTLLPVIGLVQVGGQAAADRYTYLPLIGPLFGLVTAVAGVSDRLASAYPRFRTDKVLLAIACALLVLLGRATMAQERVWKDSLALWSREIEIYPYDLSLGYSSRARAFAAAGDHQRAISDYSTAILMDPTDHVSFAGRALSSLALGKQAQACADFEQAVRLRPGRYEVTFLLRRACGK